MNMKVRENDILDYLSLKRPDHTFRSGRMLVGQRGQHNLEVYYFDNDLLAITEVGFKDFEIKNADILDYSQLKRVTLKKGFFFRKMLVESKDNESLQYKTSRTLLTDFNNKNFDAFIKGEKERVIYEDGQFV